MFDFKQLMKGKRSAEDFRGAIGETETVLADASRAGSGRRACVDAHHEVEAAGRERLRRAIAG